MEPVTIWIPGEAQGKGRPRVGRQGRVYTPPKTRAAETEIKRIASMEMAGRDPFDGPVALTMRTIVEPTKSWSKKHQAAALTGMIRPTKKPDLDNMIKLVKDALNGVVYRDDAQVVELIASKVYGPQALTVVTVRKV